MTDKTNVTVCVTAEYDKTKKEFISGNEDVKITVGNTKDITSVAEAVKIIGKLSAPAAPGAQGANNGCWCYWFWCCYWC